MERLDKIKKIGIFGGTFNPIHYGHLINLEFIREQYNLDKVILIPAKMPVHKELSGSVQAADRMEMVNLAVSDNKFFETSSIEFDRDSASYTIITVNELRELYHDDELYLIIGSDSYNELDTWKSYEELLKSISLIVMLRPGSVVLRDDLPVVPGSVFITDSPLIDISSSLIRERISRGYTAKYLTPDAVIDYINRKGLYRIGI